MRSLAKRVRKIYRKRQARRLNDLKIPTTKDGNKPGLQKRKAIMRKRGLKL